MGFFEHKSLFLYDNNSCPAEKQHSHRNLIVCIEDCRRGGYLYQRNSGKNICRPDFETRPYLWYSFIFVFYSMLQEYFKLNGNN